MFLLQLQLLSVIAPKASSTEFRWTDDELDLLLKRCADFKSQKEYQRINWEDTRNKYEKIKEIFIDQYPTEEADIERFPNKAKVEEIVTKDRISAKIKIIRGDFRKVVDSGKNSGVGPVVFTFYSFCQSLWGSSPAVNSIPNSVDSQDDSSEALESAASQFSSTVTDEIGLFDDHQKSQENANSSDDAADDDEVNSNPVGQSNNILVEKKWKTTTSFTLILFNMIHSYICKTKEIFPITA